MLQLSREEFIQGGVGKLWRFPLWVPLYCVGRVADGIKNDSFTIFLITYYAVVLGLHPGAATVVLALALVADAISDPLTAWFSDHHLSRSGLGRRHPFLYAAPVPLGLFYLGLWIPPDAALAALEAGNDWPLAIWLGVMAIGVRVSLTLFHVPHLAMTAELSQDYDQRTRLAGGGALCAWFGGLLSAVLAYTYFFADRPGYETGVMDPSAYQNFAIFGACTMAFFIWLSAVGTHNRIPYMRPPTAIPTQPFAVFQHLYEALRTSPSFFSLLFVTLFSIAAYRLTQALQLAVNSFFWELQPQQIALLVLAIAFGAIVAFFMANLMTRYLEKRNGMLFLGGCYALFAPMPVVLRLLDLMPANGSEALLPTLMFFTFLSAVSGIGASMLGTSMMADVTDEYTMLHGQRREGTFFAALSFMGKSAAALGVIFAGQALLLVGIPKGATLSDIDADSLILLGLLEGPTAAVIGAIGLLGLLRYNISRKKYTKIQLTIQEREAQIAAG